MRQIIINLDSSDKTLIFRETIRQGENLGSEIIVNLNGEFTGYHYLMRFKLNNNNEVVTPELTVVNNQVKYPVPVILSAQAGVLRVEFEAYEVISEGNTRVIKSAITTLPVAESLNGNVEIIPEDYVPWYTQAVEQATIATTQAGIATTKAEEAAQSATDAATAVSTHNTSETAHTDIRELITDIETNKADKAKMFYPDNIYGGKLVDNINTISVTGFYTAYGSSVGVPYTYVSWYIQHINSSVGVASAYQKIVSFDKVYVLYRYKIANVWGAFTPLPASQIGLADAGNLITATNVEGALQENRTQINNLSTQQSQVLTNSEAEKHQQLASNYMKRIEDYANIISMPNNANGGVDISLGGMTLKNELNYNRDTWAEWVKSANIVGDSTGLEFTADGVSFPQVYINTQMKTSTKYCMLIYVISNNLLNSLTLQSELTGSTMTIPTFGITGAIKFVFTTSDNIALNRLRMYISSINTAGLKIKLAPNIRIFELPTGSQIETDANTLTADQLAVKYPYIKGDSTKNVCGSGKMVFKGKNLIRNGNGENGINYWNPVSANSFIFNGEYFEKVAGIGNTIYSDYFILQQGQYNLSSYGQAIISSSYEVDLQDEYGSNLATYYHSISLSSVGVNLTLTESKKCRIRIVTGSVSNRFIIKQIQLKKGTGILPYEPYLSNTTYVQAKENNLIVENRMLPNLIKDEFYFSKVIGKWKRKKNVKPYTLLTSDITSIATGTTVQYITIPLTKFVDLKAQLINSIDGSFAINGFSIEKAVTIDELPAYSFRTSDTSLFLSVPIGTYADLTAVKKDITEGGLAGIKINYQLATPIETDIDFIGEPKAYPNGSAEFTPCLWGYTSTASTVITDTRYPIKAITKVTRLDVVKGKLVETDITMDATISVDLLSLNIANIDTTKIYFYECEIDSQYSANTSKVLDVEVDNGVITHDYGATATAWTLTANEANAKMLTCTNAGGATQIIIPPKDGAMYIIKNTSGQTITVKTATSTGITIATTKTATVIYIGTDFIKLSEV